jgi:hypothetical protein
VTSPRRRIIEVPALTAATWVCAALLILAGARKMTRPDATGAALQVARLPADLRLVRTLGAVEVGTGVWVLAAGGPVATALLALLYAAFAGFAEHQRRRGAGCGCFGAEQAPATALHVGVNVVAAVVAGSTLLGDPAAALPGTVAAAPLAGVLMLTLLAVASALLRLLLAEAPDLAAAARLQPERRT